MRLRRPRSAFVTSIYLHKNSKPSSGPWVGSWKSSLKNWHEQRQSPRRMMRIGIRRYSSFSGVFQQLGARSDL